MLPQLRQQNGGFFLCPSLPLSTVFAIRTPLPLLTPHRASLVYTHACASGSALYSFFFEYLVLFWELGLLQQASSWVCSIGSKV